jgi:hypothetical protein
LHPDFKVPKEAIQKARESALLGEPAKGLELIRLAFQQWPQDFEVAYCYAQMLGDQAMGADGEQAQRDREAAALILKRLCQSLKYRTPEERWKVRRHYYRFTGQHLKNRALGKAEIERGNKSGVLSIGFGCLDHAEELWNQGKYKAARTFAAEAERAFQKLLKIEPPQFNRILAYAVSLAIQSKAAESRAALKTAADLLEQPLTQLTAYSQVLEKFLKAAR